MKKKKYDIALSYASEDREYVEKVAGILRQAGVSVFYDKFEEANLWGKDLYIHLHQVYRDHSNFTVIFCSRSYAEKRLTTHELKSAQERAFRENAEYILPAKFDDAEIPGIAGTVGYIDLRNKSPKELCQILREKLGLKTINKKPEIKSSKLLKSKKPTPKSSKSPTSKKPIRNGESFRNRQIKVIAEALDKNPFTDLFDLLRCCPRCGSPFLRKWHEYNRVDDSYESTAVCYDCDWRYEFRECHEWHHSGYEQTLEGTINGTNPQR